MSAISWLKLKINMFDDEKIRLIESMPDADATIVVFIKLMIQAAKINNGGGVHLDSDMPYNSAMLATIFNRKEDSIKKSLKVLQKLKIIDVDKEGFIQIINWSHHQSIEPYENYKEGSRIRQQRYRDKKKQGNSIAEEKAPDVEDPQEELDEVGKLYLTFTGKQAHFSEVDKIKAEMSDPELSRDQCWECIKAAFFEYNSFDKKKQNTNYLVGVIKGKKKDIKDDRNKKKKEAMRFEAADERKKEAVEIANDRKELTAKAWIRFKDNVKKFTTIEHAAIEQSLTQNMFMKANSIMDKKLGTEDG